MNEAIELLKSKIQQVSQEMLKLVSSASEEYDINIVRKKFDILDLRLRSFQREFNALQTLRDISLFEKEEEVLTE